jgi:glycosyltransferase involved in cell wall biosynthesis
MMAIPAISIVIPAYDGAARLPRTLASLARSSVPEPFEVLVVDDGSRDGSAAVARSFSDRLPLKLLSHDRNRGRAAARNTGIREAAGRVVLVLDDDMEVEPDLVARHLAAHTAAIALTAAIGRIVTEGLDPEVPFHAFLLREEEWRRTRLLGATAIGFGEMLTGQFSVGREAARAAGLFDEAIGAYGLEDIEFAYRLSRAGVRFVYLDDAVSHHDAYAVSLERYCERHRMVGSVAAYLVRRHDTPEMRRYLRIEPAPPEGPRSPFLRLMDGSAAMLRHPAVAGAFAGTIPQTLLRGGVRGLELACARRPLVFVYSFLRDVQYFAAMGRALKTDAAPGGANR